jgi:hypothetical protein
MVAATAQQNNHIPTRSSETQGKGEVLKESVSSDSTKAGWRASAQSFKVVTGSPVCCPTDSKSDTWTGHE